MFLGGKGWFVGMIVAGLLSTNISNIVNIFRPKSGVIWMLMNIVPVIIVSLVVFVEEVKVSHLLDRRHKG
jgi:ABC-type branched-subunit amino acid transport system permease subunit